VEFGEAIFVAGQIAEAVGDGDEVDGIVGQGQMERVGFDGEDVEAGEFFRAEGEHSVGEVEGEDGGDGWGGRSNRRSFDFASRDKAARGFAQDDNFFFAFGFFPNNTLVTLELFLSTIRFTFDLCPNKTLFTWYFRAVLVEGEGHVAGAAAEVEDDGFGALERFAEGAGGAVPQPAVEAEGEDVVGAVVGRGDGVEHLANILGGGVLVGCAGGARSGGEFVLGCRISCHSKP